MFLAFLIYARFDPEAGAKLLHSLCITLIFRLKIYKLENIMISVALIFKSTLMPFSAE